MRHRFVRVAIGITLLAATLASSGGEKQKDSPREDANTTDTSSFDLSTASDEELTALVASKQADEASRALLDSIDACIESGQLKKIRELMPPFAKTPEIAVHIDHLLHHAGKSIEADDRDGARQALRLLPGILETAETNAIAEAQRILDQRASHYAEADRTSEMTRLVSLLGAVLTDASLDESRRVRALEALRHPAKFKPTADAAFEIICDRLVEDSSADIRWRAAHMLRGFHRDEAIPYLKKAALDRRNTKELSVGSTVRQAALEALGACGPTAAPVLAELLTGIPITSSDRDAAFDTLAQTGNAEVALPFLLNAFKSGEESEMRAAAMALGRWSTRYDEEVRTGIIETFIKGLDHPNASRRRAAVAGLAKSGDFHCIPLLRPLLDEPALQAEAQSAIRALEEAMEPYRMSFGIPPHERTMSVDELIAALEAREVPWAAFALQLRCEVADSATRSEIYEQLTALAIKQAGQPIEERMASVDALTTLSLQEKHRDEAVQAVLNILANTTDPQTHDMCHSALGRLGGPQAVRALKKAIIKDAPPDLRMQHIYQNLYQYLLSCGPEAVPILLEDIDELAPQKKRLIQRIVEQIQE